MYNKNEIRDYLMNGGDPEKLDSAILGEYHNDPEFTEILADAALSRRLDAARQKLNQQQQSKIERKADYLFSKFEQELEEVETEVEAGWRDYYSNLFWSWVIRTFHLMEDDLNKVNRKRYQGSFLQPALLGVILVLVIVAGFQFQQRMPMKHVVVEAEAFKSQKIAKFINLTPQVKLAMAPETAFYRINETQIEMQWGKVWLDVQKGGKGFEVKTPYGLVTVTGTSFGVQQSKDGVVVEVSEGTVIFKTGDREVEINAGTYIMADLFEVIDPTEREQEEEKPRWVQVMENDEWINSIPTLTAYWDFNQTNADSGLLTDHGPNGYHGLLEGDFLPSLGQESASESLFGTSVYFDNKQKQSLAVKTVDQLKTMNQDFTIMAWVKRDKIQLWNRIFSNPNTAWRFGFSDDKLGLVYLDQGYQSPCPLSLKDEWVHVAASYEQQHSIIRIYCNGSTLGQFRAKKTQVGEVGPTAHIGRSTYLKKQQSVSTIDTYSGYMDELRIYSDVLSADTIRRISKIDFLEKGGDQERQE